MTPSSPRFCTPRGTSFGLANAAQKNATTITVATRASSIGLVKAKPPIGEERDELRTWWCPAHNPAPGTRSAIAEQTWLFSSVHLTTARATMSPATLASFSFRPVPSAR